MILPSNDVCRELAISQFILNIIKFADTLWKFNGAQNHEGKIPSVRHMALATGNQLSSRQFSGGMNRRTFLGATGAATLTIGFGGPWCAQNQELVSTVFGGGCEREYRTHI